MRPSAADRLRRVRDRALVRAWQYRQRRHAQGVWFRLRRVLAGAAAAHAISPADADALVAEGYRREPVGEELEPARPIIFAPAARIARIASARPLAVRLSQPLLSAEALALTPFEPARPHAEAKPQD